MADDDKSTDETVESPKVDAEPVTPAPVTPEEPVEATATANDPAPAAPAVPTTPAGRPPVDRRSLGLGALAVGALLLAFLAGLAVGNHHDRDGRFERARDGRGGFAQDERGGDGRGGDGRGGFRGGGHGMPGPGERGDVGRGGHGGAGVVESASDDELTVAPLGGRIEELRVMLDDDTEVKVRGDDGAGDIEDAEVADIDEGDIVMVLGEPGHAEDDDQDEASSATIDAKAVIILRDGDE